jgi:hypothetical protein
MQEYVEVTKVDLKDGEELHSFIDEVYKALGRARERMNKSLILSGIYKDHVITRDVEDGRFFKIVMKRSKEGTLELGDAKEVRQVWEEVKTKTEKSEDGKEAEPAPVYIAKAERGVWAGLFR